MPVFCSLVVYEVVLSDFSCFGVGLELETGARIVMECRLEEHNSESVRSSSAWVSAPSLTSRALSEASSRNDSPSPTS